MATFTVDLLTGNLYLFTGNFNGSGSTPTSGATYPVVTTYGGLPPAASHSGEIYVVRQGTGTYVLNRKPSGFYMSISGTWRFLGDTPDFFKSDNFQIYDSADTSKGVMFVTSGISTTTFRKLAIQNSDGTIAYLTDLNTKLDKTAFNDFTGTTLPTTYLKKSTFATYTGTTVPANYYNKAQINYYTGTTVPANYYNKTQINAYTGATLILINGKQNILTAGQGISIVGNVISVTGNTTTLQLLDTLGGQSVNNITAIGINWSSQVFSGTSLSFTGGSRIYVKATGTYDISYILNVNNDSGSAKNIGTVIRKNGNTDITPMSSASVNINAANDSSTNIMPDYLVSLVNGDYVELMAFRIGTAGAVYTIGNGSWIRAKKI
jgi:hypothetical protein